MAAKLALCRKIALSIIVCNLLVVVTFTYRFLLRNGTVNSASTMTDFDDFTEPIGGSSERTVSSLTLTTVELNVFTASDPHTGDAPSALQS